MNCVDTTSGYRALRPGDSNFDFSPDGLYHIPRAGFEFALNCPYEYRRIIVDCIDRGWLKPVAYMRSEEYTWEKLSS